MLEVLCLVAVTWGFEGFFPLVGDLALQAGTRRDLGPNAVFDSEPCPRPNTTLGPPRDESLSVASLPLQWYLVLKP